MNRSPEQAMSDYLHTPGTGFEEPHIGVASPLSLPALKALSQARKAQGLPVIDQSAGDIAEVGEPMSPDFLNFVDGDRADIRDGGKPLFPYARGEVHHNPPAYRQVYPGLNETIATSYGLKNTPVEGLQTVSGRTAIDFALRGMIAAAELNPGEKAAIIMEPMAWPGYLPLAKALGLEIIHAPAGSKGFGLSPETIEASTHFAAENGLGIIGAVSIVPSNPSGEGQSFEDMSTNLKFCAANNIPHLVDGFYAPLAPQGNAAALHLAELEQALTPEEFSYLGVILGETKVISSQEKTGTLMWMAPKGQEALAKKILKAGKDRMADTNAYARPDEAQAAFALYRYPKGIHAAMGSRYAALEQARQSLRTTMSELNLPFTIGESFYGTAALVDGSGESLIRGEDGRPLTDPKKVSEQLIKEYGLVAAPGAMFSPAPGAAPMMRFTATAKPADIASLRGVLQDLISKAGQ